MSRDGKRLASHKPKNLRLQIEKEILEMEEEVILTPPEIIYEETEEVLIEPIVIKETDFENEEDERIICINTNVIYENNKIAGEQTGISSGAIKRCCNEDTKSAGKDEEGNKLVWKYVKDL